MFCNLSPPEPLRKSYPRRGIIIATRKGYGRECQLCGSGEVIEGVERERESFGLMEFEKSWTADELRGKGL